VEKSRRSSITPRKALRRFSNGSTISTSSKRVRVSASLIPPAFNRSIKDCKLSRSAFKNWRKKWPEMKDRIISSSTINSLVITGKNSTKMTHSAMAPLPAHTNPAIPNIETKEEVEITPSTTTILGSSQDSQDSFDCLITILPYFLLTLSIES
jgi:hypothetical protein